ncbi:hypothetical protein T07_8347, partial [Trichinella nelsoni]
MHRRPRTLLDNLHPDRAKISSNRQNIQQRMRRKLHCILKEFHKRIQFQKKNHFRFGTDEPISQLVRHLILTYILPVFSRPGRLLPDWLEVARKEFDILLHPPATTVGFFYCTSKEANAWRPRGDYRRLNNITKLDRYPIPNINSYCLFSSLKSCVFRLLLCEEHWLALTRPETFKSSAIFFDCSKGSSTDFPPDSAYFFA